MKAILSVLAALLAGNCVGSQHTIAWDHPDTGASNIVYLVYHAPPSGQFGVVWSIMATTSVKQLVVDLALPGDHQFYVTAAFDTNIVDSESSPSNVWRMPGVASIVDGVSIDTNAPAPAPDTFFFQAEEGVVVAPMQVVQRNGETAVQTDLRDNGSVTFTLPLEAGIYAMWCRFIAVDDEHDSFHVSVNGTAEDAYGNPNTTGPNWQWSQVNSQNGNGPVRFFTLPTGTHSFRVRGREILVPLDAVYITRDLTFIPQ